MRPPHTQTPTPRVPDVTPRKTSSKLLQLVRQRWPGPGQPAVPKPPPQSGAAKVCGLQTWWALPSSGFVGGLGAERAGEEPSTSQGGLPQPTPASPPPCHPASSRLVAIRGQLLEQSCSVFLQGLFLGEMNPASGKSPWRERCGSSLGTDWETRVTAHQPQKRLLCDFWATLSRRCEPGPRFSGK